jgi:lysozyme family protein
MTAQPNPNTPPKGSIAVAVAAIIAAVVALEGGFVDHPSDPGGATRYGITEAVARQNGYTGPMSALPKQTAIDIYRRQYIERPGFLPLVAIDAAVAEEVIDTGVNMGPARPTRFFRRAVNEVCGTTLPIVPNMDAVTVKAWGDCRANLGPRSCVAMLDSLDRQQRAEYDRLVRVNPRLRVFYRGWINHRIYNVNRARCRD